VDERVAEHLADDELSIGDYVLSGGELAAAVVVDTVARLLPGVVGNQDSTVNESFEDAGMLDCPQWTRPADFRGWKVPDGADLLICLAAITRSGRGDLAITAPSEARTCSKWRKHRPRD
jgi:tRNA (guanine-N1)-methyltransferase